MSMGPREGASHRQLAHVLGALELAQLALATRACPVAVAEHGDLGAHPRHLVLQVAKLPGGEIGAQLVSVQGGRGGGGALPGEVLLLLVDREAQGWVHIVWG